MTNNNLTCPICGESATQMKNQHGGNYSQFDCKRCGRFKLTGTLGAILEQKQLTPIQIACLSHKIRLLSERTNLPLIDSYWYNSITEAGFGIPSLLDQATSLIALIGDHYNSRGNECIISLSTVALVGAVNFQEILALAKDLEGRGLIENDGSTLQEICYRLTLDGWASFEREKTGKHSGSYGFLALKFGEKDLDNFVTNILKPTIEEAFGTKLVDMRDVSQAGIIDNIMRTKIRDSRFVIVDLTHDNSGAYWEAGYAEGLGKPVIYICRQDKFDQKATHFDTNHCTTVMWTNEPDDNFKHKFVATLQNSLDVFATDKS